MDSKVCSNHSTELIAIHPEMPWLDASGQPLPDSVLKIECQKWDAEIWEVYLKTLETPMRETLISNPHLESVFDNEEIFLGPCAPKSRSVYKRKDLRCAVGGLSEPQQRILNLSFWDDLSEREISRAIGSSRSSVKTQKKRAFMKIAKKLRSIKSNSPQEEVIACHPSTNSGSAK